MNNFLRKLPVVFLLLLGFSLPSSGQTSVTTGLPSAASSGSGANYYITFIIENTNTYPIVITSIDMYRASTSNGNQYTLFYNPTVLSGTPNLPTGWTKIDSAICSTVSTTAIHPTFSGLSFVIPASTTYRFAVQTNGSNLNYGGATTTPNSFINGGVRIGNGNYMINSLNVGYWGNSTNPRFWCGTVTFMPAGPPCNPPTGLAASGVTWTSANFTWNAVSGSSGYEYQITTSSTAPTTAGTPIAGTSYNATGLNPGTNYWFWVRNKCSATTFSNWVSVPFTTPTCTGVNAASLNVSNLTMTSADLSWSTVAGSQGYEYAFGTSATPPASGTPTVALTYNATGLTAGMTYYFHVRSKCATGVFSGWTTKSFTTLFGPCDAPVPLTIDAVNMYGAWMHWTPSPHVVQGYQYALTTTFIAPTTGISMTTDTNFIANNLVSGQTYYFWVRTHCGTNPLNNVSNLSSWTVDSFTTPSTCGQPVPAVVSNISSYAAQMDWPKYPSVASYEYVINTSATPPPSSFTGALITFNTLAATNLFSGTDYYFHLRIRCDANNVSPWNTTPFSTPPVCNIAPSGVMLTSIGATSASFDWANVSGAQQYQYSVTTTNVPDANANTYTSQPSATAIGLTPNTSYYFHVRAYCSPDDLSGWESVPFSTVSVSVQSIGKTGEYDVFAYPNPAKDVLHLEVSGKTKGEGTFMLFDLSGKLLQQVSLKDVKAEMNLSGLPQGIYLLKYRDEEHATALRIQKL